MCEIVLNCYVIMREKFAIFSKFLFYIFIKKNIDNVEYIEINLFHSTSDRLPSTLCKKYA